MVLQADDRPFGLVVEGILDTEEIVVKPLGKHLQGLSLFAGATILGDGQVALILDVVVLAVLAAALLPFAGTGTVVQTGTGVTVNYGASGLQTLVGLIYYTPASGRGAGRPRG